MSPACFEQYNPNYIGGDILGGSQDALQLFTRPALSRGAIFRQSTGETE